MLYFFSLFSLIFCNFDIKEFSYFCQKSEFIFFNHADIAAYSKFWCGLNLFYFFSYILANLHILFFLVIFVFIVSFFVYIYLFLFNTDWVGLRNFYLIQVGLIFFIFLLCLIIFFMFPNFQNLFYYKMLNFSFFSFEFDFIFAWDRLNILFLLLTSFLFLICGLLCWDYSNENFIMFSLLSSWLHISLVLTFSCINLLGFFFFFEISIWPVFLFLLLFGSRQRKTHAAYYFFMYTSFGSIFIIIALFMIYIYTGSLNWHVICCSSFSTSHEIIIWLFLFIGFATKIPIPPFHIWLPEAHVEAPTFGSVLLAGILLKLGTYGLLRFNTIPFKAGSEFFSTGLMWFCAFLILYVSYLSVAQTDLKKLIAYSSISHMLVVVMGLFLVDAVGVSGSIYLMISHGLISPALFSIIGFLYERTGTREYIYYNRVATSAPVLSICAFISFISNASIPLFAGFTGEFLVFIPLMTKSFLLFCLLCISAFIMTIYNMWIFNKIFFSRNDSNENFSVCPNSAFLSDVNLTEFAVLFLLLYFIIILGIFPSVILSIIQFPVLNNLLLV